MAKSTVYVETTVIGHLVGRILSNPIIAGRQMVTRQWWPSALEKHRLFVSRLVVDECGAGDAVAATERLGKLTSLEFLAASAESDQLANKLIAGLAIPETEPRCGSLFPCRRKWDRILGDVELQTHSESDDSCRD